MIHVGPWRYTDGDATRTIDVLLEVVAHAAWTRPEGVFDAMRAMASEIQQATTDTLETRLTQAWDLMANIRPALSTQGLLPSTTHGSVTGLFVSNGGVPKRAIPAAEVSFAGLSGDRQATRRHHGRPWQALCLWSKEVVTELQRAGHPIAVGAAGENVSLSGIEWSDVKPGVRLRLGTVLCEVSTYSIPCRKNAQWFVDGRFDTMHHSNGPVSRVYATVLEPGWITVGDTATLEP